MLKLIFFIDWFLILFFGYYIDVIFLYCFKFIILLYWFVIVILCVVKISILFLLIKLNNDWIIICFVLGFNVFVGLLVNIIIGFFNIILIKVICCCLFLFSVWIFFFKLFDRLNCFI